MKVPVSQRVASLFLNGLSNDFNFWFMFYYDYKYLKWASNLETLFGFLKDLPGMTFGLQK